jgi:hypothetical protein
MLQVLDPATQHHVEQAAKALVSEFAAERTITG